MKKSIKRVLILIALIFTMCALSSSPAESAFIPLDSPFYENFDTLMYAIRKTPNRTRPYTYKEANIYLDDIAPASLNETELKLYNDIREYVKTEELEEGEIMSFDFSLNLNPEIYFHTNLNFKDRVDFLMLDLTTDNYPSYSYSNEDKFLTWDRDKVHFLDMDLALSFNNTLTLLFRLPVTNTVHTGFPSGSSHLMSNIPFLASLTSISSNNIQDFSMNFPFRAHVALSGSWYSLMLGRERLNFGSGVTGNMVINSSLPYHNALSLSLFTSNFKYNFLISFFPYPDQYILETDSSSSMFNTNLIFDQNTNAFTGIKMFMSHRFEWTDRDDRNRFAITEGIMYQSKDGILDLQILNPMMFFHNLYIAGNSNSILSVEFENTLIRGVTQSIAVTIDDLNIPFEEQDGSEKRPNAIAIQYTLRSSHAIGHGFLEGAAELVYMSPYLYLRDGKNDNLPLDFVVAIRNQRSGAGIYDLYTIGYPNGGDQNIVHASLSYRVPNLYKAGLSFEYRAFGVNNLMTVYMRGNEGGVKTHMIDITLGGEYSITESMKLRAEISDKMFFNYNNAKDNVQNDFAFTLSYKYVI